MAQFQRSKKHVAVARKYESLASRCSSTWCLPKPLKKRVLSILSYSCVLIFDLEGNFFIESAHPSDASQTGVKLPFRCFSLSPQLRTKFPVTTLPSLREVVYSKVINERQRTSNDFELVCKQLLLKGNFGIRNKS